MTSEVHGNQLLPVADRFESMSDSTSTTEGVPHRRNKDVAGDECRTTVRNLLSSTTMRNPEAERFHLSEEELQERANALPSSIATIPIVEKYNRGTATPTTILVVGMAGSGKSTLMAQLFRSLSTPSSPQTQQQEQERHDEEDDDGGDEKPSSGTVQREDRIVATASPSKVGYFINLDPATRSVPFGASIDIRDTVDYKV